MTDIRQERTLGQLSVWPCGGTFQRRFDLLLRYPIPVVSQLLRPVRAEDAKLIKVIGKCVEGYVIAGAVSGESAEGKCVARGNVFGTVDFHERGIRAGKFRIISAWPFPEATGAADRSSRGARSSWWVTRSRPPTFEA